MTSRDLEDEIDFAESSQHQQQQHGASSPLRSPTVIIRDSFLEDKINFGESSKHQQLQQQHGAFSPERKWEDDQAKVVREQKQKQHAERLTFPVKEMLSKMHLSYSPPSIYRVPDSIRGVNPQCYTPRLVSIGPFHRDNPQLKPMEDFKIRYFKNFLAREPTDEHKLLQMGLLVAKNESEICKHYPPNDFKLNSEDFCRMILVDATFIAELIIVMKGEGDLKANKPWFIRDLLNDILLIENQIPLFIVYEIYLKFYREDISLMKQYNKKDLFLNRIHEFIMNVKNGISMDYVPLPEAIRIISYMPEMCPLHFVDYLRQAYGFGASNPKDIMKYSPVNPKQEKEQSRGFITGKEQVLEDGLLPSSSVDGQQSCLRSRKGKEHVLEDGLPPSSLEEDRRPNKTLLPPKKKKNWKSDVVTASRLLKYGVQFEKGTTTSLKDITFKPREGILKINKVIVNDSTENIFRNIVAYEQCDLVSQTYVSDYLIFMDSLIDTPEDVDILIDAGIIQNDLQDDEKVSHMFNTLHKVVITEWRDYLFAGQSRELNDYRRNLLHRWKATWFDWKLTLKRDYFYSPWSSFAFFVATILLSLTIVQTVCSVYQAKGIKM